MLIDKNKILVDEGPKSEHSRIEGVIYENVLWDRVYLKSLRNPYNIN